MSDPLDEEKNDEETLATVVFALLFILTVFGGAYFYISIGKFDSHFGAIDKITDTEKWGQYGDYIGGTINPVFAFLSLIALLATLLLQMRQLKISKFELKETKLELEKAAIAQAKLADAAEKQIACLMKAAIAQEKSAHALMKQSHAAILSAQAQTISQEILITEDLMAKIKSGQRSGADLVDLISRKKTAEETVANIKLELMNLQIDQ